MSNKQKAMQVLNSTVVGYVSVKHVLDEGPIMVGNLMLDADINATVVQRGTHDFQMEYMEVVGKNFYMRVDEKRNKWVELNWYSYGNLLDTLREEVKAAVSARAIAKAKIMPESYWEYYVLD
jgi:hypothetical protein